MYKKFVQRIIKAIYREDAMQNIFYSDVYDEYDNLIEHGIATAFLYNEITCKEYEVLKMLIDALPTR